MSKVIRVLFKVFAVIVLSIAGAVLFPLSVLLEKQHEQDELEKVVLKDEI